MVLSSWQSHCDSSPGSFDECRLSAGWAPTPDQANQLGLLVHQKWHLSSTSTIAIYYYSALKLILVLPSHGGQKAEST